MNVSQNSHLRPIGLLCLYFISLSAEAESSGAKYTRRSPTAPVNSSGYDVPSTLLSSLGLVQANDLHSSKGRLETDASASRSALKRKPHSDRRSTPILSSSHMLLKNTSFTYTKPSDNGQPSWISGRPAENELRDEVSPTTILHTSNQKHERNVESSTQYMTLNPASEEKVHEKGRVSYDDYKVELNADQMTHFPIDVQTCFLAPVDTRYLQNAKKPQINGTSGIVYLANNGTLRGVPTVCSWTLTVPERHFIAARLEAVPETCTPSLTSVELDDSTNMYTFIECSRDILVYSSSNTLHVSVVFNTYYKPQLTITSNLTMFYLFFTTVPYDGKRILPVIMTSQTTGYVTSIGFGSQAGYPAYTNARCDLIVPPDHVVMTRFRAVDIYSSEKYADMLIMYEIHNETFHVVVQISGQDIQPIRLSKHSLALVMISGLYSYYNSGFTMEFSYHSSYDTPVIYTNGRLDCSWSNYPNFRHHVRCDLVVHCADGRDEDGHCPYSSQLCKGMVALGTKCYMPFQNIELLSWFDAVRKCKRIGGQLATMKSPEEWEAVRSVFFHKGLFESAYVGLWRAPFKMAKKYRSAWIWSDTVIAYSVNINYDYSQQFLQFMCARYDPRDALKLFMVVCRAKGSLHFICETDFKNKLGNPPTVATTPDLTHKVNSLWSQYEITECPLGHVTFSFMSCEPSINCSAHQHQASCTTRYIRVSDATDQNRFHGEVFTTRSSQKERTHGSSLSSDSLSEQGSPANRLVNVTVAMFACDVGPTTLPYSLVCDHEPHCPRGSDETFCKHDNRLQCDELRCASGQCYTRKQRCDRVRDCHDSSDESSCLDEESDNAWKLHAIRRPPPTIIDFDGRSSFSQRPMNWSESCPETHFTCSSQVQSHCLPVYVRCNNMYDCPGREDEMACDHYACPGFYRCRKSRVCVHAAHMCDGWPQCPKRDDELYCGLTCSPGCFCQGLAVVCSVRFPAHEYPRTRYLDVSRSNMKTEDLSYNPYLVWLSLASCSIERVSHPAWPNLKYLDLSRNNIHNLSMNSFLNDTNLVLLILAGNPLTLLIHNSACFARGILKFLDLSETKLRKFDSTSISCYPHVTHLNFSNCPLDHIREKGFKSTLYLTSIDLSGCPVSHFPRDIFKTMKHLKSIWTGNYKLCCKATLPMNFNEKFCFATFGEISSCEDLLKSNFFRGCMWIFAALSVLGNVFCLLFKVLSDHNNRRSGFNIFVINLTIADFLMGMYLVIVGVADQVYRGRYLWHDTTWKTSTACTVAGFLSLLSSEMSAFTICLITLDRFIVLTFPFTTARFKGWSATLSCGLVWAAGVLLASVPLFPDKSRWEFYGQTGICIPLPTSRKHFSGHDYAFGVMVILNFFLCVLIAAGQASIYRSVQANSMTSDSSRKSQDLNIARRLITVAASDFLCWFPIGLLGILSSNDVPVSSEVSVAMAIFVLPLNSALNPFLYTFSVVMEGRRKVRETQLIKLLEARIKSQQSRQQTACNCSSLKPDQT